MLQASVTQGPRVARERVLGKKETIEEDACINVRDQIGAWTISSKLLKGIIRSVHDLRAL